jgi:6-phosphogluconolactonase
MAARLRAYIGTYSDVQREGLFVFDLDGDSDPQLRSAVAGLANPSFLALHPSRRFLYAVHETDDGAVSAFALDVDTGTLRFLNRQSSVGCGPCHLTVDAAGRFVLVTNYASGSVAVLPIRADGALAPACDSVQHRGSSAHPQRQTGPHPHSVTLDPANRFALIADLGLDHVMIYRFDAARGKLAAHTPSFVPLRAGAGPRHFAFHPNGRCAYVINELDNTIVVFDYDPGAGMLREKQLVDTLPAGYADENVCADIHVAPSGRFLYASNRGHDSLVGFTIADDGRLQDPWHVPTGGRWPRNFALDPSSRHLWVANQHSDAITRFQVDAARGQLTPVGQLSVPQPACIVFAQVNA